MALEEIEDAAVAIDDEIDAEQLPDGDAEDETVDESEDEAGEQDAQDQPSDSSTENKDKGSAQERIKELNGKYRSEQREKDYWKSRAGELEAQSPKTPSKLRLEKTLEDFEYDVDAFSQYAGEEAVKAERENTRRSEEDRQMVDTSREFLAKEGAFAADIDDYDKVTRADDLKISASMKEAIMASDDGPALLYYLGKNPDVAANIANLPPIIAARELGRLEVTELSKPVTPKTKTLDPPARLVGKQGTKVISPKSPDSDKLSTAEWNRRMDKLEGRI